MEGSKKHMHFQTGVRLDACQVQFYCFQPIPSWSLKQTRSDPNHNTNSGTMDVCRSIVSNGNLLKASTYAWVHVFLNCNMYSYCDG